MKTMKLTYLWVLFSITTLWLGRSNCVLGDYTPCPPEQVPPSCEAVGNPVDVNGDHTVNLQDFALLAGWWLQDGCQAKNWCNGADIDQSTQVNLGDFAFVSDNWLWPHPIEWLMEQQNLTTDLVVSYEDDGKDFAYTFDQALAIIAFTEAREWVKAREILDKMYLLQQDISNGAWYECYIASDPSTTCEEKYVTGPIAWMVIAINFYEVKTGDSSYADMARSALGWLDTMRNTDPSEETYGSLEFSDVDPEIISTEHNMDAYSAYFWRGIIDLNTTYIQVAHDIYEYLRLEMWGYSDERNCTDKVEIFWEGYGKEGDNCYYCTDPQSWGVLALGPVGSGGERFYKSLDWLWYSPWGNTRTVQDYCDELNVEGFKSATGDADYVEVDMTEAVVAAYYSIGDELRGNHFHDQMRRTISCNSGLIHSFRQDNPDDTIWNEHNNNYRYNYVASTVWYYFNERKINPFIPYSSDPYPMCWACPTQCHGDADCDGDVDKDDLSVIYISHSRSYPDPSYNPCADCNRDGVVNILDFMVFEQYLSMLPSSDCQIGGVWPPF